MASVINTNLASLYAQRNLQGAQSMLSTSVERLSSGLRINRAKDDAAGLGISEQIKTQINALNMSVKNANDAISMVQTAEGSMSEVSDILQRMKELSVQARNDSLSTVQRGYIADELLSLRDEINAISDRTTYNDMSLLKSGLRTSVASTAANVLHNGAEVLPGLVVSELNLKNVNAGSYSITSATKSVVGTSADGVSTDIFSQVEARTIPDASTARNVDFTNFENFSIDAEGMLAAEADQTKDLSYMDRKYTLTVDGVDYSVVVGSDSSLDTAALADEFVNKLDIAYPGVTAAAGVLTFDTGAGLGDKDISLKIEKIAAGEQLQSITSTVDDPDLTDPTVSRDITIDDYDVVEGRTFTVRVGNPETYVDYSVIVGAGMDSDAVAAALTALIDDNFAGGTTAAANVITFDGTDNTGMSNIQLFVYEPVVVETQVTVNDEQTGTLVDSSGTDIIDVKDGDDATREISLVDADMPEGTTVSISIRGKEYAVVRDSGDDYISVADKLTNLINQDLKSWDGSAWTGYASTGADGTITIAAEARVGTDADITVEISNISNAGTFTITANADTGSEGSSDSVNFGSLAAGETGFYNFNALGVSFKLTNTTGGTISDEDFSAFTTAVNSLVVSSGDNNARFQTGASVGDVTTISGFNDIRINGFNKNSDTDSARVFDDLSSLLDTISEKSAAALSVTNFGDLETAIDDAIETISGFRASLGSVQNRLEHTIGNLQTQSENLTAANSRIRDTDYAAETANLTRTQIMQQAATAMLAQANQMPNVILALLK
jgi:flagellin